MTPTPAELAAVAAVLKRQNDPACHTVADALDAYLSGKAGSINDALGLRRRPGQARNSTLARLQRRNTAIVAAAERYDGTPEEERSGLHPPLTSTQAWNHRPHGPETHHEPAIELDQLDGSSRTPKAGWFSDKYARACARVMGYELLRWLDRG